MAASRMPISISGSADASCGTASNAIAEGAVNNLPITTPGEAAIAA